MLTRNDGQIKLVTMTIEDLMPQEHFLRDLDKYVDFSFIYNKVEHLYSETGRPSVDPVMLFKMILIGFLYGIESERRLEKEINVNIAYKWFLKLALDEIAKMQCENNSTDKFKYIQRLRKIRCEGNFSIQKECHNLRRTYKRGDERVTAHCLFSALALNLRRLVRYLKGHQITLSVTA